jgi:hypothetical protein
VSGTWTGWWTATAEVSGQCLRQDRSCSGTSAEVPCRPDTTRLTLWARPGACDSSVPGGPRPAASRKLHVPGGYRKDYPVSPLVAGGAGSGRIPLRAPDCRGHQPGHVYRTSTVRTAVVPEAADGQSADGSGSLQLSLPSSRPALRAAAGGGRPRASSDTAAARNQPLRPCLVMRHYAGEVSDIYEDPPVKPLGADPSLPARRRQAASLGFS